MLISVLDVSHGQILANRARVRLESQGELTRVIFKFMHNYFRIIHSSRLSIFVCQMSPITHFCIHILSAD